MLLLLALLFAADGNQASALLKDALVALKQGHIQEAKSGLQQASRLDPQNAYIWSALAETYARAKDPVSAASAAANAERIGGANPVVCHALAMYYSGVGDFAHAAKLEQVFAASGKADPGALSRTAELFLKAGNAKSGLDLARLAQQQNQSALNEDLLAQALLANGQQEEAFAHLQSAWNADKDNAQIAFDWLQLLLKRGEFGAAAEVASAALAVHPDDPQMLLALGVARYGQRRFEEAIVIFLHVIQLDASIDQPYRFLGRMLGQAGNHLSEIIRDDQQWVTLNPQNAKAKVLLAKALLAADDKSSEAESLLRASLALDPQGWEAHYELGVLLASRRKYSEAADELKTSARLAPNQPETHYHLAQVYDRLGDTDRARAERELHQKLTAPK